MPGHCDVDEAEPGIYEQKVGSVGNQDASAHHGALTAPLGNAREEVCSTGFYRATVEQMDLHRNCHELIRGTGPSASQAGLSPKSCLRGNPTAERSRGARGLDWAAPTSDAGAPVPAA